VVHQAQKCRAKKRRRLLAAIRIEPGHASHQSQKQPQFIKALKVSNYAEIVELLKKSENTQTKENTHYSQYEACLQQTVQSPFSAHGKYLVQVGFHGDRHHFVHEQIEKMAVHRGRAASNVKFRRFVRRHGVHRLFTLRHNVRSIQASQPADHLMIVPVVMVEEGSLWSWRLRNSCQNAFIVNVCVKRAQTCALLSSFAPSARTIGGTRNSYFGLPPVPAQSGRLRMDSDWLKPRRSALPQSAFTCRTLHYGWKRTLNRLIWSCGAQNVSAKIFSSLFENMILVLLRIVYQ